MKILLFFLILSILSSVGWSQTAFLQIEEYSSMKCNINLNTTLFSQCLPLNLNLEQGVGKSFNSTHTVVVSSLSLKKYFLNFISKSEVTSFPLPFSPSFGVQGIGSTLAVGEGKVYITGREGEHSLYSFDINERKLIKLLSFGDVTSIGESFIVDSLYYRGHLFFVLGVEEPTFYKVNLTSLKIENKIENYLFLFNFVGDKLFGIDQNFFFVEIDTISLLPSRKWKLSIFDIYPSVSLSSEGKIYYVCRPSSFGLCSTDTITGEFSFSSFFNNDIPIILC